MTNAQLTQAKIVAALKMKHIEDADLTALLYSITESHANTVLLAYQMDDLFLAQSAQREASKNDIETAINTYGTDILNLKNLQYNGDRNSIYPSAA